jgi:HPt (histidine-containing phosphotransfer) domain-containing protein
MANAALALLRRVGGEALVVEMIELFLEDSPPRVERIRSAVAASDAGGVAAAAHSLRGSCGNLGLDRTRGVCERLELAAVQRCLAELPDLFAELDTTLAEESDELRAELDAARAGV